ncbi:MAG: FkbM family methyltransferase [Methylobacterium sp.]|uniref:FkbM family methyltransferase n=1 Tax=Methylobacterium sp. TaxID=409 RepID=UPI00260020F2|nr:FkbM family methyltransferase [Methylobacterium sp.]MBX9932020.1 FkbM family methyltransferase [Methylobacterium sp.]
MWFNGIVDAIDVAARIYMRLSGKLRPKRIGRTYFGAEVDCDIQDFIQRRIYYFGIFEPNLSHYIGQRVAPGDHVVDVGANIGYVTLLASRLVGPGGKVTAIEASPTTFAKLRENLRLNGTANVSPVNAAATGERCLVEIVDGSDRNIGSGTVRIASGKARMTVPGTPVSILIEGDASVSLIKIDIEGSEGPVLDDILANLPAFPGLKTIAVELSPSSADRLKRFEEAGFTVYALPNNYRIGATLVRAYLDRSGEGAFVVKHPVAEYSEAFTDYVLERETATAASEIIRPDVYMRVVPSSAA